MLPIWCNLVLGGAKLRLSRLIARLWIIKILLLTNLDAY